LSRLPFSQPNFLPLDLAAEWYFLNLFLSYSIIRTNPIHLTIRFRGKVLQQTWGPRFQDIALEFYSFVTDNYAPFYSIPTECTDRDAAYVLDGLLYNESDLAIEEHFSAGCH
jgi:hypothetical protein